MVRAYGWVMALSLALVGCSGDDGSADTDGETDTGTGTDTDTDGTSMSTTTSTSMSTSGSGTTTTMGTSTTSGTTDDSTTTGGDTDTDGGSDTDAGTGGDTDGGMAGEYPACEEAEPQCPDGFDVCANLGGNFNPAGSHCTIFCDTVEDCPSVDGATAEPSCGSPGLQMDRCTLDCAGDLTCPDGMECLTLFAGVERCGYPS